MKSFFSHLRNRSRTTTTTTMAANDKDDFLFDYLEDAEEVIPDDEPPLDAEVRRSLLGSFACPFRKEAICRYEATPTECPFGHPSTSPNNGAALLDLPDYICIYHLLGKCKNPRRSKQIFSGSRSQIKIVLRGCTSAIHPDPIILLDLEQFEASYASIISEYFIETPKKKSTSKPSTPKTQKTPKSPAVSEPDPEGDEALSCGICFERIRSKLLRENRRFALLEACDHLFCGPCLVAYRQSPGASINCPMCRVPSRRFYLSDRFLKAGPEKRRIFEAFRCGCCD